MKTFNKIFMTLGVSALCLGATSCVNDLDLEPTNPSDITDASGNIDNVFADIYMNFSTYGANGQSPVEDFDGGMASFQRALFIAEEIPTDEASWLWDPADYGTMNYGIVTPDLNCVFGFYSRLNINIALCNQFINTALSGGFTGVEQSKIDEYVRQARILRGGCYYYMLSFYDKIPYADENTKMGEMPTQLPRAQVYELVTSDLEKVVAEYAPNQKPHYGFVGLDAAESILAKIYLNGEVFAGRADYDKCYQHCKNVINRLGKGGYYGNGLAQSYLSLFGANNKKYVVGNDESDVNEIIWTLAQNDPHLLSWSGATFMAVGWIGTNGVTVSTASQTPDEIINGVGYTFDKNAVSWISSLWYNVSDGWKSMVARKSFIQKFEWLDGDMTQCDDTRTGLFQTAKHGFSVENPTLIGDDWGKNGYLAPKYSNWNYNDDGSYSSEQPQPKEQLGGDYAVIRLAEIYLTAAEAILQGGGGSQTEARDYINYVRQRAYGDKYVPYTSVNMSILRDERCRELYTENNRRTDLIRWNQWCTGYTWEWKGGVETGTTLPEYTKLYPIPSRVMVSSPFEQTTGY